MGIKERMNEFFHRRTLETLPCSRASEEQDNVVLVGTLRRIDCRVVRRGFYPYLMLTLEFNTDKGMKRFFVPLKIDEMQTKNSRFENCNLALGRIIEPIPLTNLHDVFSVFAPWKGKQANLTLAPVFNRDYLSMWEIIRIECINKV